MIKTMMSRCISSKGEEQSRRSAETRTQKRIALGNNVAHSLTYRNDNKRKKSSRSHAVRGAVCFRPHFWFLLFACRFRRSPIRGHVAETCSNMSGRESSGGVPVVRSFFMQLFPLSFCVLRSACAAHVSAPDRCVAWSISYSASQRQPQADGSPRRQCDICEHIGHCRSIQ